MAGKDVRVDQALKALGAVSAFPLIQCAVFFLSFITDAHQLFSYVFTGQDVEHSCSPPANDSRVTSDISSVFINSTSLTYGQCVISVVTNVSDNVRQKELSCVHGMQYEGPKDQSFVSEYDLVCERKALASLTQTLFLLGNGIGAIVFPWLSDLYGRKRIVVVSLCLELVTSLVAALAPIYVIFAVAKLCCGFLMSGIGLVGVTAAVEAIPSSHRAYVVSVSGGIWWSVCIASVPLIAFPLRFLSWRTLQLVLSSSSGLVVFMVVLLEEPVHWLVAKGRLQEAEKVLKRAAKWNRQDPHTILQVFYGADDPSTTTSHLSLHLQPLNTPHSLPTEEQVHQENAGALNAPSIDSQPEEEMHRLSGDLGEKSSPQEEPDLKGPEAIHFRHFFLHRQLRKNILLIWFIWITDCMTYMALYLMSDILLLKLHWGFLMNSLVEGTSFLLMSFTLNRLGRKWTLGMLQGIAGLGLIASGVCFHYKDNSGLQIAGTVFSLCGKMAIGGAYCALFLYTPEVFPTEMRNRALGMSAAVSTFGGMIAPFFSVLADYAVWAPGAVFGTSSLLAILFLLALPESKGRKLPQNIRDLEKWYDVTSSADSNECPPAI